MMSSVADRRAEIATLRVLGLQPSAAFTATLAEAIVLSLAGALLGAAGLHAFSSTAGTPRRSAPAAPRSPFSSR